MGERRYKRLPRFVTYKRPRDQRCWVQFYWNTYREVLTPAGVGRTIGAAVQVGRRVFGIQWRRP